MPQKIEIRCSPAVNCQRINQYLNYCPEQCDNCRRLMQKVRLIATEASESCRKNLEITCYGDHIHLCFSSGSRGNQIVVQAINGKVYITTCKKTWKESLKGLFKRHWRGFLGTFLYIFGKALTVLGASVPWLPMAGKAITVCAGLLIGSGSNDELETDRIYRLTN